LLVYSSAKSLFLHSRRLIAYALWIYFADYPVNVLVIYSITANADFYKTYDFLIRPSSNAISYDPKVNLDFFLKSFIAENAYIACRFRIAFWILKANIFNTIVLLNSNTSFSPYFTNVSAKACIMHPKRRSISAIARFVKQSEKYGESKLSNDIRIVFFRSVDANINSESW